MTESLPPGTIPVQLPVAFVAIRFGRRENGVYELVPLASNAKAVEEVFMAVDWMFSHATPHETLRYIVADDLGVGMPPLARVSRMGWEWMRQNPNHNPVRTAFVFGTDLGFMTHLMGILQVASRYSRSSWRWKFFTQNERDAALAWLNSDAR